LKLEDSFQMKYISSTTVDTATLSINPTALQTITCHHMETMQSEADAIDLEVVLILAKGMDQRSIAQTAGLVQSINQRGLRALRRQQPFPS